MGSCLAHSPSHVHTYLKILQHCLPAVAAFRSKTGLMTGCDHLIMLSFNKRMMNGLLIKCAVKSVLITDQL